MPVIVCQVGEAQAFCFGRAAFNCVEQLSELVEAAIRSWWRAISSGNSSATCSRIAWYLAASSGVNSPVAGYALHGRCLLGTSYAVNADKPCRYQSLRKQPSDADPCCVSKDHWPAGRSTDVRIRRILKYLFDFLFCYAVLAQCCTFPSGSSSRSQ